MAKRQKPNTIIIASGLIDSDSQQYFSQKMRSQEYHGSTYGQYCTNPEMLFLRRLRRKLEKVIHDEWEYVETAQLSWEEVMERYHQDITKQAKHLDAENLNPKDDVILYMVSPMMEDYRLREFSNLPFKRVIYPSELVIDYCQQYEFKKLLFLDSREVVTQSGGFQNRLKEAGITVFSPSGRYSVKIPALLMEYPYRGKNSWYCCDVIKQRSEEEILSCDVYDFFGAIQHSVKEHDIDAVITSWRDFEDYFKERVRYNFPRRQPREGRPSEMPFISISDLFANHASKLYAEAPSSFLCDWYLGRP